MKKLFVKISYILIVLIVLSSCAMNPHVHLELALCGSYAVPGMFCADLKGGTYEITILEKDAYGRIYFSYSAASAVTQETETALVICQSIDREYVYFYEDICYILQDDSFEAVKMIKEQNDWSKPLDYSKMSRRPNQITFDLFISTNSTLLYGKVIQAVSSELGLSSSQLTQLQFVDADNSGSELYWSGKFENGTNQSYLLLVSSAYDVCVIKLDDDVGIYDVISDFKAENGWTYGN